MIFQEISWVRSHGNKICPALRKATLEWYRPPKHLPCFIQKPVKYIKQRWRKIPVIVQLKESENHVLAAREIASLAGCPIHRELPLINAFATKVNAKTLESLVRNNNVNKIWYDRKVMAVLDVASPTVQAPPLWNAGFTGKGIVVAVVDTGIYEHPDLAGRIVAFKDLVNQQIRPYDDNGHGTHVAGDIASNGSQSNFLYRGPAPEAGLVGVKVLDKNGSGLLSTVIDGIQWCIDNRETTGIRVLNLSLGSPATESYTGDPLCQAVEKAWDSGIVVCAAAGNEGPEPRTISSPGIHPGIITVGAMNDMNTTSSGDDRVADFSSRGPTIDDLTKPDVLAPGVNIISLRAPGSTLDKQNKQSRVGTWYSSLSGTSMATPVCAGVVAQLLQANGSLTPDRVKARLVETALKLDDLDPNTQGAGVINAQKAASAAAAIQQHG
jgi:serine protease AprX